MMELCNCFMTHYSADTGPKSLFFAVHMTPISYNGVIIIKKV